MSKKYTDYSVLDLYRSPLFLVKPNGEYQEDTPEFEQDVEQQIEAITHAYVALTSLCVPAATVSALQMFGCSRRNRIITDKKAITDIVFKLREERRATALMKSKLSLTRGSFHSLDRALQSNDLQKAREKISDLRDCTLMIEDSERKVRDLQDHIERNSAKEAILRKETNEALAKLDTKEVSKQTVSIATLAMDVAKELPLTLLAISTRDAYTTMLFMIDHDIVLQEYNPAAGIDYSVNLGRFGILYTIHNREASCSSCCAFPLGKNIVVNGYYHPHISSNFGICFGSEGSTFSKYRDKADLVGALGVAYNIINSYYTGNPYQNLVSFHSKSERSTRRISTAQALAKADNHSGIRYILSTIDQDLKKVGETIAKAIEPLTEEEVVAANNFEIPEPLPRKIMLHRPVKPTLVEYSDSLPRVLLIPLASDNKFAGYYRNEAPDHVDKHTVDLEHDSIYTGHLYYLMLQGPRGETRICSEQIETVQLSNLDSINLQNTVEVAPHQQDTGIRLDYSTVEFNGANGTIQLASGDVVSTQMEGSSYRTILGQYIGTLVRDADFTPQHLFVGIPHEYLRDRNFDTDELDDCSSDIHRYKRLMFVPATKTKQLIINSITEITNETVKEMYNQQSENSKAISEAAKTEENTTSTEAVPF